jgi:hypothetical protein
MKREAPECGDGSPASLLHAGFCFAQGDETGQPKALDIARTDDGNRQARCRAYLWLEHRNGGPANASRIMKRGSSKRRI